MRLTRILTATSASSARWLRRQAKDPYVKEAQQQGYRARSAFKLIEINKKFRILRPGMTVVDCGAAPGSWSQVASEQVIRGDKSGLVVGCDLLYMEPITGVCLFPQSDFTRRETQEKMLQACNGRKFDVVLSDMAPNASGVRLMDHDAIVHLVLAALRFAVTGSEVGASFLCKMWDGRRTQETIDSLKKFYKNVKRVKPKSSRDDSSEIYLLARDFRGIERDG